MSFVKELVGSYLGNDRCIILYVDSSMSLKRSKCLTRAVVPANVDIATQEIVHMAEEADSRGERTLGVLTKPDLVDRGAEDKV